MNAQTLANEAKRCREMATTMSDRQQSTFLLSAARAFEDLAIERKITTAEKPKRVPD